MLAETFGEYVTDALEPVKDFSSSSKDHLTKLSGFALLRLRLLLHSQLSVFLTWMNFFSLKKYAAKFQVVITFFKLLCILLIICTGLYHVVVKGLLLLLSFLNPQVALRTSHTASSSRGPLCQPVTWL